MRVAGVFLLVVLIAAAVVLLLNARGVEHHERALRRTADELASADTTPASFDLAAARRAARRLEAVLAGSPATREELAALGRRAASWAAGAPSGSAELTAAVALREAADALRSWLSSRRGTDRRRAELALRRARAALSGETATGGVQGIQDRLRNLQENELERIREAEEAAGGR